MSGTEIDTNKAMVNIDYIYQRIIQAQASFRQASTDMDPDIYDTHVYEGVCYLTEALQLMGLDPVKPDPTVSHSSKFLKP